MCGAAADARGCSLAPVSQTSGRIIGSGVERVTVRQRLMKHFLEDVLKFSNRCFTGRLSAHFDKVQRFESGQSKSDAAGKQKNTQDSTMN